MRRIALSLAALVLVAGAYCGYWLYSARRLRDEMGPWAAAQQAEGYAVAWQHATVEGFPLAFRLRFDGATLQASRYVDYALSAAKIEITARPWNPSVWHFSAPQGARLDLPEAAAAFDAAGLDGEVSTAAAAGAVDMRARRVTGNGVAQGFAAETAEVRLSLPAQPPESHLDPTLSAGFNLEKLTLSPPVPGARAAIDEISLALTVKGRLQTGPLGRILAAWRDDGGALEVKSLRVVWGKTSAVLSGTLALDAGLQPIGALTATIENPDMAVDAAVASGSLEERFAESAKTILGMMAKTGADGQPVVNVPISLQNGALFLGPARVAALPHFTWE